MFDAPYPNEKRHLSFCHPTLATTKIFWQFLAEDNLNSAKF